MTRFLYTKNTKKLIPKKNQFDSHIPTEKFLFF